MTRRSTIAVLTLAALTLAGLFAVSNLIGGKRTPSSASGNPISQATPVAVKQSAVLPPAAPVKPNQLEAQFRSDLGRAQALLDQLDQSIATGDWKSAGQQFSEFDQRTQLLPAPQLNHPDISPVMQDFFALYKVQLARAIAEQNVQTARFAANQLFGVISEHRARFGTRGVPIEFQRLGFLIREIGIWNQAGDTEMIKIRSRAIEETWREIRPVIVARRNGIEPAKRFDMLIERLRSAEQAQDLSALMPEFAKEFDILQALFQHPPRQSGAPSGTSKPADEED